MTGELDLLKEFRAEIPACSDETRRHIYAQATGATDAPRRRSRGLRRRMVGPVAVAAAVAASLVAVFVFATGSHHGASTARGVTASKNLRAFIDGFSSAKAPSSSLFEGLGHGPGPTIEEPLGPPAKQVSMADAAVAFGSSVVLPSTSAVQPSNAGPVWEGSGGSSTTVAVTFPAQGLIIGYMRPAPYSDPATGYQQVAQGIPSSQVIELSGTPALAIPENTDETGANFGVVAFEINGTEVRVMGHDDQATLEAIAQSILTRS